MFKTEKCILNYACFKHPWVLEVMSIPVGINEKIVLRLWLPSNFFNITTAILKNTFFSRTLPVSASEDDLNIDYG